jgi:hypothetical protein
VRRRLTQRHGLAADPAPSRSPRKALAEFWPHVKFIFERTDGQKVVTPAIGRNVPPEYWPLISALVAAQFLTMAKDTIYPKLAVALIMEPQSSPRRSIRRPSRSRCARAQRRTSRVAR